ncbi:Branched-chain-amino-acid aminotransferase, cytosolic [Araneus ventricosus]|uniref:Branched-chain-amino-acid aminotransferase n=1 Tax=Araneus ventricosus TaxID=182803 RepID=A0A4Y2NEG8_ARAVE|nr:Branched-chain-amino-acid aminotransferase, cytosolic [Araneus ventricosus]
MEFFVKATILSSRELFNNRLLLRSALKNTGRMISSQSFKYDDLTVNQSVKLQPLPDPSTLFFGKVFSDHMLKIEWTESDGWGKPQITPLHYLLMHPGSKVLHYAQAVFEGMKAFKRPDSKVALFRPDLNMKRLLASAERASLPSFDCEELLKCIKKLISVDLRCVPDDGKSSLYVRPTYIGSENSLGVSPAKSALLYVVTCPSGPYFKTGLTQPVSLLADPNYVRACPGGAGAYKLAANYAPSLYVQKLAQDQGLHQVLWLYGKDHQVCEAGAMNVFFLLKKESGQLELVTPPLDGTILPGVTRQSVLDLARSWKEFEVSERNIVMQQLINLNKENRLLEMFICGTACTLCPVNLIRFEGIDIKIPTMESGNEMYLRFMKAITDIQYGRIQSNWSVPIE